MRAGATSSDGKISPLVMISPSEFIALSTAQMRKQFEIVSGQNKELGALAQEIATEAAGTIKTGISKTFNKAN